LGPARITLTVALLLPFLLRSAVALEQDLAIEHQGIARQVILHVPDAAPAGKLPLIIYLHGVRPDDWKITRSPRSTRWRTATAFSPPIPEPSASDGITRQG
jgi:poly(3-hydroxybutyrate) depolymerase